MLYLLVRPVVRFVLSYYFRNIDVSGLENIPKNAAVILAANHPTAFIEPCILACTLPRQLWFLARGNLYKNRLATAALRALHILPVYRLEDGGFGKLRNNFSTFRECFRALSARRTIMILAEGRTIHEKRLRPLRKGVARVALGALEEDTTLPEVYVVPVGVNFTDASKIGSTVMIRYGQPILTSDYRESYRQNGATALRELTRCLRSRLENLLIIQQPPEEEDIRELQLEISRNNLHDNDLNPFTATGFQLSRELAVSRLARTDRATVRAYAAGLKYAGVTDAGLVAFQNEVLKKQKFLPLLLRFALACVLALPQLPVWLIAQFIAQTRVNYVEFYSPVRFAAVCIGTFLYLPALLFLPWFWKIYLLISCFGMRWAGSQAPALRRWGRARKVHRMVAARRERLFALREEIGGNIP